MKFVAITLLLVAGLVGTARAQQEADDKYIAIYGLIQQADTLAENGDPGEALAAFTDVQNQLQRFQKQFSTWNPNIVAFRLNHINDQIAELKNHASLVSAAKKFVKPAPAAPTNPPPANDLQLPTEMDNLRTQLLTAQAANEIWQAKLKEALAVQPSAADPRELERAQEKIRALMKQIDLFKASHGSAETTNIVTQFVTNVVTVIATNHPTVVATSIAEVFAKNTAPLVVTNFVRVLVPDTNALEMAKLERAAAVRNFNDEHDRAEQLANEILKLRQSAAATNTVAGGVSPPASPGKVAISDGDLAALREENALLKKQIATLRAAPAPVTDADKLATELKQSRALVASLQSEAQINALEKLALERKLQLTLTTPTNAGVNVAEYESRIRELTLDRDRLIEKLDVLSKQTAGSKNAKVTTQVSALNDEVTGLRARLAVAEAQSIPYTDDEQALFKTAVTPLTNPDAEKKSIREMPPGTAELVASAQQHFAHQEYGAAEADYAKILDRDQNNGIALANLATIEMQQGKLEDAEKHIRAALVQSPDDAYNLATLGYLKFQQAKYDDALNALSRAAQIDPNNPEIQNYLGVTLSHKGQRKAAETALRRAIQLSPNYAPAHNNLAVIYLSQTPPLAELARWHYQKAIDAGQPHNPDLEKLLADKGAPVQ